MKREYHSPTVSQSQQLNKAIDDSFFILSQEKKMYKVTQQNSKHLINWVGGKRILRKVIAEMVPDTISSYIEPFGGGAWVLFYKEKWAKNEVYNDIDNRLYNFFNVKHYIRSIFIN